MHRRSGGEVLAVFATALCMLGWLLLWLDDVHIGTTNGMYKSIRVESWVASFAAGKLDYSNYMYYPLMAVLCRVLDALGIYAGMAWKQLAVINTVFGAVSLAIVFATVRDLTGRRDVALMAALLHLGSAFFLMLSVTSEDILPGYTLVLGAASLAALWFDRPTVPRVLAVAALFTFGWLLEWRLLFPTLPALTLALLLAPLPLRRRAALVGVLLVGIVLTAEIVALCWDGHDGSGQIHQLLWTGKAVDTGWGGFGLEKLPLSFAGMGEYLLGAGNLADRESIRAAAWEWGLSLAIQALLLASLLAVAWPRRREPRIRALLAIFLGTFAAGQVFNLYIQPQDPQMQLNVMPWITIAWAMVLAVALPARPRGVALLAMIAALVLSAIPLAYNVAALAPNRGSDSAQLAALREIETNADPSRTVFVYLGFEGITAWKYLVWTHRWSGVCDVEAAPTVTPKFKWIAVNDSLVHKPGYTSDQHAAELKRQLDCAFDKGYRVVASDVWSFSPEALTSHVIALRGSNHAAALHKALHDGVTGHELFAPRRTGPYYELRRR